MQLKLATITFAILFSISHMNKSNICDLFKEVKDYENNQKKW